MLHSFFHQVSIDLELDEDEDTANSFLCSPLLANDHDGMELTDQCT